MMDFKERREQISETIKALDTGFKLLKHKETEETKSYVMIALSSLCIQLRDLWESCADLLDTTVPEEKELLIALRAFLTEVQEYLEFQRSELDKKDLGF
jgi:hypothetical protein